MDALQSLQLPRRQTITNICWTHYNQHEWTPVNSNVYIYVYIYIYTHTGTYIHTYMPNSTDLVLLISQQKNSYIWKTMQSSSHSHRSSFYLLDSTGNLFALVALYMINCYHIRCKFIVWITETHAHNCKGNLPEWKLKFHRRHYSLCIYRFINSCATWQNTALLYFLNTNSHQAKIKHSTMLNEIRSCKAIHDTMYN